jgi:hypothetical protein
MTNNIPPEWKSTVGDYTNNNKLIQDNTNKFVNDTCKKIIVKIDYYIPSIYQSKIKTTKPLCASSIDLDFQTRSDVLPNSYFKDLPRLLKVTENTTRGHYEPGIAYTENDLIDRPRKIVKSHKKNDIGIDKTLTKNLSNELIYSNDVVSDVSQKNKYNTHDITNGARICYHPLIVVPVVQYTKILTVVT